MSPQALREAVASWAAEPGRWAGLVRHDPHERTFALLHRDDELEVYLVCWMPGHDTGFHDHDDSAAEVAVVRGSVREERLALGASVEATIAAGESRAVPRSAIHRIRHAGQEPAITLHAYSPPLSSVGTYEVDENGALLRHPRPAEVPLAAVA